MDTPHHRRDFARALALGVPAALALPAAPRADEPAKKGPTTEADARMQLVVARYGDRLDDASRAKVRAEVEAIVRRAGALRAFPLENGDGPFPVFHPYRAPLA